jgi:IclR family acetate operon transcriptional repressor
VTLDPITPLTITDPAGFREQLDEVRASGIAMTRGESAPGLAALAVPVFDDRDEVAAALGLVIPDQIFDNVNVAELRTWLFDAARGLSLKLGASTYPFGGARQRPVATAAAGSGVE